MNKIWQRSGFGGLLVMLGKMVIWWAVDDKIPTSSDWEGILVLVVVLLGYQIKVPSHKAP